MGDITQRLGGGGTIALDTSVFIYHFESHSRYVPATREVLAGVQSGRWQAVTSILTLMELTVRPWQFNRAAVAHEYEVMLAHFPNLRIVDVTRDVARLAAQLRAAHRLRSPDALHIATAITQGAAAFVTNDKGLAKLTSVIEIILLDELLPD